MFFASKTAYFVERSYSGFGQTHQKPIKTCTFQKFISLFEEFEGVAKLSFNVAPLYSGATLKPAFSYWWN